MAFTKIVGAGIQTSTDLTIRNVQAGIITATKFVGDISDATGAAAGLGTALSQVQASPLNKLYYTNTVLSVGSTITVDPPDSSNIAYTQYSEIAVEEGFDLIVEDGDDLVPDILGLSTETAGPLYGAGGRVRADNFTNKAGTGAPSFPNGVVVSGVSTFGNTVVGGATTELIVNGDARVTGILTIGTSSITLDGSENQVNVGTGVTLHHTNGVQVGGNTVHSTGITVNNINASGIITASTSITVGDKFINTTGVGLGETDTTGRNAGVGTATGTIIYNSTLKEVQVYKGDLGWRNIADSFIEATGGTISDYEESGIIYRAHIFTSSGTFTVTSAPAIANIDYLVVAGGGGGGSNVGGGGGAGGLRYSSELPVTSASYPIQVGAGGAGGTPAGANNAVAGTPSIFSSITSQGGGYGGMQAVGGPGGSGGGGAYNNQSGGTGDRETGTSTPAPTQGNPGGAGGPTPGSTYQLGGGGGGAGGAGTAGSYTAPNTTIGGPGGSGSTYTITGISSTYAGGGGGSTYNSGGGTNSGGTGGSGGGGNGGTAVAGTPGVYATGGGGGGGAYTGTIYSGGSGGSGIVVVRYVIGNLVAAAKATGGAISYYNGKTIHTFISSGTFANTSGSPLSIEYVVVAGGGGGGGGTPAGYAGGGGGAGGYQTGTTTCPTSPVTVTVGAGGVGQGGLTATQGGSSSLTGALSVPTTGGGYGGAAANPGGPGGSGGGGAHNNSGSGAPGGSGVAGPPRQGYNGATGLSSPNFPAGGGGGAGGAASPGGGSSASPGGIGVQLPATFRNPQSTVGAPGPGGSGYWVGGGGGGGTYNPVSPSPTGGGPGGPYAGGGNGGLPGSTAGSSGIQNTGGGGGGQNGFPGGNFPTGSGGSGIVIIAYPS